MINTQRLKDQLIIDEGLRQFVYKCTANKNTIGVGRNMDDNPIKPDEWLFILSDVGLVFKDSVKTLILEGTVGLSDNAIDMLLLNDINSVLSGLKSNLKWFDSLDVGRQEMLVNLVFQIGMTSFLGFKNMIIHLSNRNYMSASHEFVDSRYWRERITKNYTKRAQRHYNCLSGT